MAHDTSFITVQNDTSKYQWSFKADLIKPPLFSQHKQERAQAVPQRRHKRQKHQHSPSTKMINNDKSTTITPPKVSQSSLTDNNITNNDATDTSTQVDPTTISNTNTKQVQYPVCALAKKIAKHV